MALPISSFVYAPLEPNNADSFRLLHLLPGDYNSPIKCILEHTRRTTPFHPYEALSYTWGDPSLVRDIIVNDLILSVTENLHQALRSLRYTSIASRSIRTLWVDAICINQSYIPERNQQVAQMQEIYAGAERVVIWLGKESEDSDMGITFIKRVCESPALTKVYSTPLIHPAKYLDGDFQAGTEDFQGSQFEVKWEAVARLLSRPWWKRAWVVQEIVAAKSAICYCGNASIEWDFMAQIIEVVGTRKLVISQKSHEFRASGALDRAWGIAQLRIAFAERGHIDLWGLLHRNRLHDCADPRDKVYSIVGMTDQNIRKALRPDYTKSVSQIFTMAVITDIEHNGDLKALIFIDHDILPPKKSLPSWVADFERGLRTWRFRKYNPVSNFYKLASLARTSFSDDLRVLHAEGYLIDVIEDNNVQKSDMEFQKLPALYNDKLTWDIANITAELMSGGGIRTTKGNVDLNTRESFRRSVEGSIYDVMIAGQLSTVTGWVAHSVSYSDDQLSLPQESGRSGSVQTSTLIQGDQKPIDWENMLSHASNQTRLRTLVLSKKRYLGLAPKITEPGDIIFILFGLREPAILRPQADGTYLFVGTAYVHGIMNGETSVDLENGVLKRKTVSIR